MMTQWRPVPDFPNYEMTVRGEFRRIAHQTTYVTADGVKRTATFQAAPVAVLPGKNGRLVVKLLHNGVRRTLLVHRLILWVFGSPPPFPRAVARHYDDDPTNNSLDNLRWGSYRNNWEDAQRNGIEVVGRRPEVCSRGHRFTPENTYTAKSGKRSCRKCQRLRDRRRYAARQGNVVIG